MVDTELVVKRTVDHKFKKTLHYLYYPMLFDPHIQHSHTNLKYKEIPKTNRHVCNIEISEISIIIDVYNRKNMTSCTQSNLIL